MSKNLIELTPTEFAIHLDSKRFLIKSLSSIRQEYPVTNEPLNLNAGLESSRNAIKKKIEEDLPNSTHYVIDRENLIIASNTLIYIQTATALSITPINKTSE